MRPLLAGARSQLRWSLDVRYRGQAYELTVPLAAPAGHRRDDRPRDARLPRRPPPRVRPLHADGADRDRDGALPGDDRAAGAGHHRGARHARPVGSRTVHGVRHAVHDRVSLDERSSLAGPAIVEQEDSTVTVPRGWTLEGRPGGTLLLERG